MRDFATRILSTTSVRIMVLMGLVVVTALLANRPFILDSTAAAIGVRVASWTFGVSDLGPHETVYTSPAKHAPFAFTAAGVFIEPGAVINDFPGVELRLRASGGDWSPWYAIGEFEPEANGRFYGEDLVTWPAARDVQLRITSVAPLQDAIQELTVIIIDASDGPTAAAAAESARIRTESQAAVDEAAEGVPQPTVISRAEWGANESWMTWTPHYAPVDKAIVHHTVSGGGSDPAAEVRSIYYYHAVTRGWGDIGYNYLVDPYGNIYEGRHGGPDVIGAHVSYWNEGSLGMSVLGCYDNESCSSSRMPTQESLSALADLVAWASSRRLIDPRQLREFSNSTSTVVNYVLAGHRDYGSTVCPGDNIYAELPNLRGMAWERVPEYDARFGWHDTPSVVDAGEQVTVYPTLSNNGRLIWSDAAGVRLGYRWFKDGNVVAENTDAAHIISGAVVGFGETTSLVAQLTAPAVSGNLTLRWDLYRDGVGWFADQPAPSGRSQPLDVAVEVTSGLALDVRLVPAAVTGGASLRVDITIKGPPGKGFETRTLLPSGVEYVAGSAHSDVGDVHLESTGVFWTGNLPVGSTSASFEVYVSSGFTSPIALSTQTTFSVAGFEPLGDTRWLVVNGYQHFLALIGRTWVDNYEENDHWLQAHGPLVSGQIYRDYPDDIDDYYYIQLSAPATVNIRVDDYVPTSSNGTVALYGPAVGNDQGEQIDYYGTPGHASMLLGPHSLEAGKYYIRVYTASGHSTAQQYSLTVTY